MNCLFLIKDAPISPNAPGGGPSVYYSQLLALKESGANIFLLHYADAHHRGEWRDVYAAHPEELAEVKRCCTEMYLLDYTVPHNFVYRIRNKLFRSVKKREFDYELVFHPVVQKMDELIAKHKIDVIWAQTMMPAILALNAKNTPCIYMHHDWLYRVKALRTKKPEDQVQKNLEESIVMKSQGVVSGSFSEYMDLHNLGHKNAYYIPITYEHPIVDPANMKLFPDPQILHLGSMGTTANRIGLKKFIEEAWDGIGIDKSRLLIIGSYKNTEPDFKAVLETFNVKGYVEDLTPLMRFGDIHIIPWDQNTGQRTRLPLMMSYGQVVVAVEASVLGFPELIDGYNCLLAKSVKDLVPCIKKVLADDALREKLARNALDTFDRFFTRDKLVLRYNSVVFNTVKKNETAL